jgi:type 1 glutamine amidotransferase
MTGRIDAHFVAAGKYHDIDFARLEVLKLLAELPHIRTTVANDYSDVERIANCRFLVTYTCDLMPTHEQAAAIRKFLEAGGRWLALHGTNSILRFTDAGVDSPEERPDVMDILGGQFKAHPPIGEPFRVKVIDPEHPLTRGLEDFDVVDELYLMKMMSPVKVLMQTNFTGEATGFVDAQWDEEAVPVLFLRELGKGGVLYNTLGHCRGHFDVMELMPFWDHPERCAWNYPVYYEMLRRGIRWATGELA